MKSNITDKNTSNESNGTDPNSSKIIKLIFSFILGMVISFIMVELLGHSALAAIAVVIIPWIIFGVLAYNIILGIANSKGASILGGIIGGAIGMWIFTSILWKWKESVELADTFFGLFIRLLPVGLILTFIIYCIANLADKKDPEK